MLRNNKALQDLKQKLEPPEEDYFYDLACIIQDGALYSNRISEFEKRELDRDIENCRRSIATKNNWRNRF